MMDPSRESGAPIATRGASVSAAAIEDDSRARTCPRCGGPLVRVRRRLIDRLFSTTVPLRRYRCYAIDCSWVGNLRARAHPQDRDSQRGGAG
jgi:hypothetical protein